MGSMGGQLGDGDERSSLGEVDGMGRGDASRREDGWAGGDERSSSGEVNDTSRGKGGQSWIAARGQR